ncbi:MAG TPA: hypothetical protein VM432_03360 [Bdellovibrionales bacterium]|nr:hypothetical protein [Bdellovibrionales bacterium]
MKRLNLFLASLILVSTAVATADNSAGTQGGAAVVVGDGTFEGTDGSVPAPFCAKCMDQSALINDVIYPVGAAAAPAPVKTKGAVDGGSGG